MIRKGNINKCISLGIYISKNPFLRNLKFTFEIGRVVMIHNEILRINQLHFPIKKMIKIPVQFKFQIVSIAKDGKAFVWNCKNGSLSKELTWRTPDNIKYVFKRCRYTFSSFFQALPFYDKT